MNAIAKRAAAPAPMPVLRLTNFAELVQFAQMAAKSRLVPQEYRGQPESIMLAVQLGSELGLAPLQSIQNIAIIGSRPTVWGDAMLALVLAHPDCEDVVEGTENDNTAICTVKRRGRAPVVRRFSVSDAKLAALWGKSGPWSTYPSRMLQMRARGFALRDAFPDVLKGLITAEEARDIPPHKGPTLDAVAEPMPVNDRPVRVNDHDTAREIGDSIPALDDEPTPPESTPADSAESDTLRAQLNAAVPLHPQKPTIATWLAELEATLAACPDRHAAEAACLTEDVCRAARLFTGDARARLKAIMNAALARYPEPC
jgi:hypothetical protein